ncbi:MAG: HvfC family RiPP maturation protein [bacterium]
MTDAVTNKPVPQFQEKQFQEAQRQFANHLRDPEGVSPPQDIEERRLKIYRDLIFNNIKSFIDSGFPVLKSLHTDEEWQVLVRRFIVEHRSHTPYFLEISQEFLHFLQQAFPSPPEKMPFLLELAHYEWVELALAVSSESSPSAPDQTFDVMTRPLAVSPLAWRLSYQFPVHRISAEFRPERDDESPTFLIVYRDSTDAVRFLQVNAATSRLVQLLEEQGSATGARLLELIADEIGQSVEAIEAFGKETFRQLYGLGILVSGGH